MTELKMGAKKKESKGWARSGKRMVIARSREKERGNGRRKGGKKGKESRETIFQSSSSVVTFFPRSTG